MYSKRSVRQFIPYIYFHLIKYFYPNKSIYVNELKLNISLVIEILEMLERYVCKLCLLKSWAQIMSSPNHLWFYTNLQSL